LCGLYHTHYIICVIRIVLALTDNFAYGNIYIYSIDTGYDVSHPDLPSTVTGKSQVDSESWKKDGAGMVFNIQIFYSYISYRDSNRVSHSFFFAYFTQNELLNILIMDEYSWPFLYLKLQAMELT